MRILLVHNRYKQPGGEDSVFQVESDMLVANGHVVEHLLYENSHIKTFIDKITSGLLTIYNPRSAHAIKLRISAFKPDLIHVHNFFPLISPSVFFVSKRMNVPVIFTLHNYRLICPSATLFFDGKIYEKSIHSMFPIDAIRKAVYRNSRIQTALVSLLTLTHHFLGTWKNKVSGYIVLTRFAKQKFKNSRLALQESKLFLKPNFVTDNGSGSIIRQDFFLFVGRLTQEKGIETLLNALTKCDFKLTIIGDGPLRKLVEDAAQKNKAIHYLGPQSKSEVISQMKNCRALIFPSVWYEGFPLTILEAFSTGTPVIASSLGGMKEIIQNRMNGLHFIAGDVQDLISKIMEISAERGLATRIGENARLTYLEHYSPSKNYEKLMGVYQQVIDQRS